MTILQYSSSAARTGGGQKRSYKARQQNQYRRETSRGSGSAKWVRPKDDGSSAVGSITIVDTIDKPNGPATKLYSSATTNKQQPKLSGPRSFAWTKEGYSSSTATTPAPSSGLKRVGGNKLVTAAAASIRKAESEAPPSGLKRGGDNKLISSSTSANRNGGPWLGRGPAGTTGKRPRHQSQSTRFHSRPPVAKRIKLSVVEEESRETGELDSSESIDSSTDSKKGKPAAEKLTDFAYRGTAVVSGKQAKMNRLSRNKYSAKAAAAAAHTGRNMGLVRVQQDIAKTPICPTFLRGIPCQDERCQKRHDVPKEHCMPVCSFFQRKGMCYKEDCPFRHVKVNPSALACPNFAMLGYCDDATCTMMHSRARRTAKHMTIVNPKS